MADPTPADTRDALVERVARTLERSHLESPQCVHLLASSLYGEMAAAVLDLLAAEGRLIEPRDLEGAVGVVVGQLREARRQVTALQGEAYEVAQILGRALGCPEAYPDLSDVDDGAVVIGERTIVDLAQEAADRLAHMAGGVR